MFPVIKGAGNCPLTTTVLQIVQIQQTDIEQPDILPREAIGRELYIRDGELRGGTDGGLRHNSKGESREK